MGTDLNKFLQDNFHSFSNNNYSFGFDDVCRVSNFGDLITLNKSVGIGCEYIFIGAKKSRFGIGDGYDYIDLASAEHFLKFKNDCYITRIRKTDLNEDIASRNFASIKCFAPKNKPIGFMGGIGSGKSFASVLAKQKIGQNRTNCPSIISFADSLRIALIPILQVFEIRNSDDNIVDTTNLKNDDAKTSEFKNSYVSNFNSSKLKSFNYYAFSPLTLAVSTMASISYENLDVFFRHTPQDLYQCETSFKDAKDLLLEFIYALDYHFDKDNKLTIRKLYQLFGTEFARNNLDKDFWIKTSKINIMREYFDNENYYPIFDDVRFENEASFVKSMGGIVIGINRPDAPILGSHSSESTMRENWDMMASVTIENEVCEDLDLSIGNLRTKINEILERIPDSSWH